MLKSWLLIATCLLHLGASQHHEIRHKHRKREDNAPGLQDAAPNPDAVHIEVYVDEDNNVVSSSTIGGRQIETPQADLVPRAQKPTDVAQANGAKQQQALGAGAAGGGAPGGAAAGSGAATDAAGAAGAGAIGGGAVTGGTTISFKSGVTYGPYNADRSCKSDDQVQKDLNNVGSYDVIRLYGTDCDQVAKVAKVIKGKQTIFVGIFDIKDVQGEVKKLASQVGGNWGIVKAVTVGNELVNSGQASVEKVVAALSAARSALQAAGYKGPVATADTMVAMKANPKLCQASDFCAINCHAFFDGNVEPGGAGKFVAEWANKISQAAGGKTIVVAETGWPTSGSPNKAAVPGQAQQQQAVQSLKASFSNNLILLGLYNDMWKQDRADTHGAEKYWGLKGNSPSG